MTRLLVRHEHGRWTAQREHDDGFREPIVMFRHAVTDIDDLGLRLSRWAVSKRLDLGDLEFTHLPAR